MTQLDLIRGDPALDYVGGFSIPGTPVAGTRDAVILGRGDRRRFAKVKWRDTYVAWKANAIRLLVGWRRLLLERETILGPIRGPVVLEQRFWFGRPGVKASRPGGSPPVYTIDGERVPYPLPWTDDERPMLGSVDLDNLTKGPGDALVGARILQDDRWAFRTSNSKHYVATGDRPRTVVRLWRYHEGG